MIGGSAQERSEKLKNAKAVLPRSGCLHRVCVGCPSHTVRMTLALRHSTCLLQIIGHVVGMVSFASVPLQESARSLEGALSSWQELLRRQEELYDLADGHREAEVSSMLSLQFAANGGTADSKILF